MAVGPLNRVIRHLRRLGGAPDAGGVSDGLLLERFAARRDEAAFAELVRRHGPTVFGVCRRVLGNAADADDAFQATFMVLARKAGSLRQSGSVGSWLYGVAQRTALKARTRVARRRLHEGKAVKPATHDAADDVVWRDLWPVLDEELGRLPEKYRAPVVLCYLEGKTQEEAARLLGWPTGTVATRLNRARDQLRDRLTRRGLTLTGGTLAAAFAENLAPAAVPASLAETTIKAAILFAAGRSAAGALLPAGVVALAEGVLRTMLLTKLKMAAAAVLAVGVLGFGANALRPQGQAAEEQSGQPVVAQAPAKDERATRLKELLAKRTEVAEKEFEARRAEWEAGKLYFDFLTASAKRLLTARLEEAETKARRIDIREAYLKVVKEFEDVITAQYEAGRKPIAEVCQIQYERMTAEIELEREKAK